MSEHPDLDALSASLDEESIEGLDAHLQSCARCREQRAHLAQARAAVGQPVAPLPAAARERAIAQALTAAVASDEGQGGSPPAPPAPITSAESRPRLQWWLGGAAAAVVAFVLGAVVLLSPGPKSTDETALSSGPATERDATAESFAGDAAGSSVQAATGGVDLGNVSSVEELRGRVPSRMTAAAESTSGGSPAPAAAPAMPLAPSAGGSERLAPVPGQVGTRVCEEAARTARPQLGVVVFAANLRYQGTPAVVLGFAPTATGPPATLLVLAPEQGCRVLAETPF